MKKLFVFALAVFFAAPLFCLDVPELSGPVVDNAGIIDGETRASLEEYLLKIDAASSAQIAVLTIPSLEGEPLEEYGIKVARSWALGESQDSKGVLLLVAFKEKKIRIETGYGAEGDLTDAKCGLIIRNVIAPQFQDGDYSAGIEMGVKAIAGIVAPSEETQKFLLESSDEFDWKGALALTIFWTLYLIMFTGCLSTKFKILRWLPWSVWFKNHPPPENPGASGNGIYVGGSGHSSFGSGSGGGFSGHGGGFGGGGASGGW